jgi:1,2-phenylacetyl-CoA epoxidase catalytic subunit
VVDEGRHVEVFLHRLRELGVEEPELEAQRRANPRLLEFRRRLLELVAGRDWEAALFAQNVILEAMEFAVFETHARTADPITRDVLQRIVKDERRHIGFGENALGRALREFPELRLRLRRVKRELDDLVLATFRETISQIAASSAEELELGRTYLAASKRLGLA